MLRAIEETLYKAFQTINKKLSEIMHWLGLHKCHRLPKAITQIYLISRITEQK